MGAGNGGGVTPAFNSLGGLLLHGFVLLLLGPRKRSKPQRPLASGSVGQGRLS